MSFIQNIFGKKEQPIQSNADFWNWFRQHEKSFFNVLSTDSDNTETKFFDHISPKLEELKDGYYLLAGMFDDHTAELIISAEGEISNMVFVEELIAAAPKIDGWKFTALKQPDENDRLAIKMDKYDFNHQNIHFTADQLEDYPDEISISLIYDQLTDLNLDTVRAGIFIFLDNYLGELDAATKIDNISIISRREAIGELIPITKLKSYLIWREKEFIEKYDGFRHDTENDAYSSFEAELPNGNGLIAIMNTTLLNWEGKASHPWLAFLTIKYDGEEYGGMPDKEDYQLMDKIEDEIMGQMKDTEGYLNLGRQTADNEREVYFACTEFRLPSKVLYEIQQKYNAQFEIKYEIYKDKYWKWFEQFNRG